MVSKAKILQPIARFTSVCSRIDDELDLSNCHVIMLQTWQILLNAWWERMLPEGPSIWKAKLSEQGTKCCKEKNYLISVAVIRPQSLPSVVFCSTG